MTSLVMNKRFGSKDDTWTSYKSHTKRKVTVSNVMRFVTQVTPGHSTFAINQLHRSGFNLGTHLCIREFWQCLTSLINSTITVGLTICTCLQSLPRQHTHIRTRCEFLALREKVEGAYQIVSSRKKGNDQQK